MADPLQPTPPHSGMPEPAVPPPVPLVPEDVNTSPVIPLSEDKPASPPVISSPDNSSLPLSSPLPSEPSLSGLAQAAKEVVSVESPPETTVIPPPSTPPSGDTGQEEKEQKKKKSVSVGIIALLLFFGLSIGGSVFYLTNKETAMWYAAKAGVLANYPETPPTMTCSSTITSQFFIRHNCGGGQVCSASPFTGTVVMDRYGPLKVKYATYNSHCSDVKLDIYVNDQLKAQTDFLVPKASTEYLDLGTVEPGSYTIKIVGTGRTGGCNAGDLGGWGGTLYFQCPIVATPTPTHVPFDKNSCNLTINPPRLCSEGFECKYDNLPSGTPLMGRDGVCVPIMETPTITPTPINTSTPTPTNPPSAPGVCDASCDNDAGCSSGFTCASVGGVKRCRKPECPDQYTCVCPATPTPTTSQTVVVTATPVAQAVVVTATPTPTPEIIAAATPKVPVSGTGSVLGVSTIAGGILLLLLGLLL